MKIDISNDNNQLHIKSTSTINFVKYLVVCLVMGIYFFVSIGGGGVLKSASFSWPVYTVFIIFNILLVSTLLYYVLVILYYNESLLVSEEGIIFKRSYLFIRRKKEVGKGKKISFKIQENIFNLGTYYNPYFLGLGAWGISFSEDKKRVFSLNYLTLEQAEDIVVKLNNYIKS